MRIADLLRYMKTLNLNEASNASIKALALLIMGGVGSLLEAAGIALIFPFISLLNDPAIVQSSTVLTWTYDALAPASFRHFAIYLGCAIALIFILKNVFMIWLYYLQASYAAQQRTHLANRIFRLYLLSPYAKHQQRNSAEQIRNIAHLIEGPYSAVIIATMSLVADVLAIVGIAIVLLAFQPLVTVLAGSILGVVFVVQSKSFKPLFHRLGAETATLAHEQQEFLQRGLGGFKEVKSLSREAFFLSGFKGIQDRFAQCMRNYQFANRLPPIISEMVFLAVILLIIVVFLSQESQMDTAMASLALLAGAGFRLMPLINRVLGALNSIRHSHEGVAILAREISDLESTPLSLPSDNNDRIRLHDTIVLQDVCFAYPGAETATLLEASLTIGKGQCIGLVGRTGAGKTTLADMLLGLLDFDSGTMLVDGADIKDNLAAWRANTGYVPQDIFVINDTIRRNVAFALADHEIDDTRVIEALKLAQLGEFLDAQPQGLDAMLGERGVSISGGQRQRIGIARTLYQDPEVIIFDEATSSLDTKTERELTDATRALRGDKTIIIVAHRLNTIRDCDNILFMKDGRIVASGSYDELLAHEDFAEIDRLSHQKN